MMGMPTAPAIPNAAIQTLKVFSPNAKAFFITDEALFGVSVGDGLYQWVRYEKSFGFVDAGTSTSDQGAQRIEI
jgi:hypothetical protein